MDCQATKSLQSLARRLTDQCCDNFVFLFFTQNKVGSDYVEREDLERVRREIEARYRMELNRKLEDVNNYLEEQARARDKLDVSRDETEFKIRDDHKKIQVKICVLFAQPRSLK